MKTMLRISEPATRQIGISVSKGALTSQTEETLFSQLSQVEGVDRVCYERLEGRWSVCMGRLFIAAEVAAAIAEIVAEMDGVEIEPHPLLRQAEPASA